MRKNALSRKQISKPKPIPTVPGFPLPGGGLLSKLDGITDKYMRQLIQKNTLLIALICMTTLVHAQRKKKNSLKGHTVKNIEAKVGAKEGVGPGTTLEFGISAELEDGSYMNTTGMLNGKVKWNDFKIEVNGGSYVHYLGSSNIVITNDNGKIDNHEVVVQVSSVYHTSLKSTLKIPLDYKLSYFTNFSGENGQTGERGTKGSNGANRDRDEKQTGKGKTGGDGQDGRNGKDGMDGPDLDVGITLAEDGPVGATLLKVTIQSGNSEKSKVYLVDAHAGSLTVKANGGDGGPGGTGGDGGTAGWGQSVPTSIDGSEGGDGGTGGNGGSGGDGGDGGNGGRITVSCDAAAKPFLKVIQFEASGGSRGTSGYKGAGGSGGTSGQGYRSGKGGPGGKAGSSHGSEGMSGQDGLVKFVD